MTIPLIPAEGAAAYPVLNAIVVTDLVGPLAANRQHVQQRTRTNTLRTIVNALTVAMNHFTEDGPINMVNPTLNVGSLEWFLPRDGSALMWGKLGLANTRTYVHNTAFDGTKFHWFLSNDTGQAGESTALGLKRVGAYDYELWLRQGGATSIYKVVTTKDFGSGSGIDADYLDGLDSLQFLRSDTNQERIVEALCSLTAYATGTGAYAALKLKTDTHSWIIDTMEGSDDDAREFRIYDATIVRPMLALRSFTNRITSKGLRIYQSLGDFSGPYMGVGDSSQGTPVNWGGNDFSSHTLQWPEDGTARFLVGNVQVFTLNRPGLTQTLATLYNVAGASRDCYLRVEDAGYGVLASIGFDGTKNANIELGARGAASSPFIDFHSVGTNVNDFDVRIIANGGSSGTNGQGQLTIHASMVNMGYLNVTHNAYLQFISCGTDIWAQFGKFSKNVPAMSDLAYGDGHLQLQTADNSLPRIGFLRAGTDALTLYYAGGTDLRGRGHAGFDDRLAWVSDISISGGAWIEKSPGGGAPAITTVLTGNTDTTKVLAPNGVGAVQWLDKVIITGEIDAGGAFTAGINTGSQAVASPDTFPILGNGIAQLANGARIVVIATAQVSSVLLDGVYSGAWNIAAVVLRLYRRRGLTSTLIKTETARSRIVSVVGVVAGDLVVSVTAHHVFTDSASMDTYFATVEVTGTLDCGNLSLFSVAI